MAKKRYKGMMPQKRKRTGLLLTAFTFALASLFSLGLYTNPASAANGAHTFEFTQSELDDNWEGDRQFPTGGVESVSAFDRDDVAQLGIDSDETAPGTFQRTEGIKTVNPEDFGNAVKADLYIDPEWEDTAVRAGLWVVGDDGSGERDNLFGIIEFVNLEPSDSGDSAKGNHEGWRWWDSVNGWTNLNTEFEYGEWHSLKIELDGDNQEYNFFINDELEGTGDGGENFIREVFLNSYNYGEDEFPNLNSESYEAHWHGGIIEGEIISPEQGETIQGALDLLANYTGDPEDDVFWAVRSGTCAAETNTVLGNVDGLSNDYDWENGEFSASFDVTSFESGDYCFIFNPGGNQNDVRETVEFFIQKTDPDNKNECKKGGWADFNFRNQGQCIKFVNTGMDSR